MPKIEDKRFDPKGTYNRELWIFPKGTIEKATFTFTLEYQRLRGMFNRKLLKIWERIHLIEYAL